MVYTPNRRKSSSKLEAIASGLKTGGEVALVAGTMGVLGAKWAGERLFNMGRGYYKWASETKKKTIYGLVLPGLILAGTFNSDTPQNYMIPGPAAPTEATMLSNDSWAGSPLFAEETANKVAHGKNITPGDYFIYTPEKLEKLTAFLDSQLYPIFPPAVLQQKKLIYGLSAKTKVPPNVIATVISMESGGNDSAQSNLGLTLENRAQGLCQVMPLHFFAKFGVDYVRSNPKIMLNPQVGCGIGMDYFAEVLQAARENLKQGGFREDDAFVFGRAFISYNGGGSTLQRKFGELYQESKFYGDHPIRYFLDAEIAKGLRDAGYSDSQIVQAMQSPEIDARAFALHYYLAEKDGSYRGYNFASELLKTRIIGEDAKTEEQMSAAEFLRKHYNDFIESPAIRAGFPMFMYDFPFAPSLRLWASGVGGAGLLKQSPANTDVQAYYAMDTSRN